MATQRLFVGLPLPQGYQQGLAKLQESLKEVLSGKFTWTRPGNWHLTLKFLGDTPEDLLPAVEEALAGVSFSRLSPRAGAGGVFPSVKRPRVMWLGLAQGSQACADLAAKIEAALLPLGFPPGDKAFIPHLTLGRIRWSNSGQDWGKALEIMLKSEWETVLVDRFILWRSMLGQGTSRAGAQPGPVYLPLRAYPASG